MHQRFPFAQRQRLGQAIGLLREVTRLSQPQFARKAGWPTMRQSRIERGAAVVRPRELKVLTTLLPGLDALLHPQRPQPPADEPAPVVQPSPASPHTVQRLSIDHLPELVKVRDVAATLGVSQFAVRELVRLKHLDTRWCGRLLYITRSSVQLFVNGANGGAR